MRWYVVTVNEIRAARAGGRDVFDTVTVKLKLAGEDLTDAGVELVIPGWRGDVKIGQQFRLTLEERPW